MKATKIRPRPAPRGAVEAKASGAKRKNWRWIVFAATWLVYAGYYLCRKNYPVAQPVIMQAYGWTGVDVGIIISAYLGMYALGQFVWGLAGDFWGARKIIGTGLVLSIAANVFMGFSSSILVMALLWGFNGLVQATGWPGTMKTMSAWFGIGERGRVMAWWSTCYQVGELASTALASYLIATATVGGLNRGLGLSFTWQYAFWLPCLGLALIGVLFLLGQRDSPEAAGLPGEKPEGTKGNPRQDSYHESAWAEVLGNKYIWNLAFSYFCVKLVRYAFMFWLSTYLVQQLGFRPDKAGFMSIFVPLAGFFGTVAAGYASDKFFGSRRAPVSAGMMAGLALSLFAYSRLAAHPAWGPVCLCLIGFMTFGPDTLISATSAMDFGSRRAASTAAGFINGMGSIGAAVQGVLLGYVSDRFGWNMVFSLLIGLAMAGFLLQASMWNARGKN